MQSVEENHRFSLRAAVGNAGYATTDRVLENFDPAIDIYTSHYYCKLILSLYANCEWVVANPTIHTSIVAFQWIWGFFLTMITIAAILDVANAEITDYEAEFILKWIVVYLIVFFMMQYIFNGKRFWREFPHSMVTIGADTRLENFPPFSKKLKSYKFNVEPESSRQFLGRLQIVESHPDSLEGMTEYKYKLTGVRWFHILRAFVFAVVFIQTNLTSPQYVVGNHYDNGGENDENSGEGEDGEIGIV